MKRKIICILLIAVLTISLTGCSLIPENGELRAKTEKMMDALLANDEFTARMQLDNEVITDTFSDNFVGLRQLMKGATSYKMTRVGSKTNFGDGVTTISATYLISLDTGDEYVLTTAMDSAHVGLLGFHMTPKEKTDLHYTGTLGRMKGATPIQWFMLILGMLEIAFVLWMLIDCCCRRIRLKALWIVIILLGSVAFSLKFSTTGMNFNFDLSGVLSYTAMILYGSGTSALRVMLPIGALVYLCCRAVSARTPAAPAVEIPVTPAEETPAVETPADLPEAPTQE